MPFLTAGGHSLEYQWIEGEDPALVFLHEGLGSIRQWRDFPLRVAAATGCRVLLYNRYGYGNSEVLQEKAVGPRFMHREGLEVLPDLLRQFRVGNPILVGHSDGASIALIYAGAGNPAQGVAVLAPHVFVEESNLYSIRRIRETFEASDLPQKLGKYHKDARKTFYLWNDAWLDPAFKEWNIEEYLPGIHCPVLAIQGGDDEYGTLAQLDAIRRGVSGGCTLVELPGCGHSPHRDKPEAVLLSLVEYIQARKE